MTLPKLYKQKAIRLFPRYLVLPEFYEAISSFIENYPNALQHWVEMDDLTFIVNFKSNESHLAFSLINN